MPVTPETIDTSTAADDGISTTTTSSYETTTPSVSDVSTASTAQSISTTLSLPVHTTIMFNDDHFTTENENSRSTYEYEITREHSMSTDFGTDSASGGTDVPVSTFGSVEAHSSGQNVTAAVVSVVVVVALVVVAGVAVVMVVLFHKKRVKTGNRSLLSHTRQSENAIVGNYVGKVF